MLMLSLAYTPRLCRSGIAALFALDDRLGQILRTTREPMVGQMRLTWWYEALLALDNGEPPAEPVLAALASDVLPLGVTGSALAGLIDGWEVLLGDEALTDDDLGVYAKGRGGRLFTMAARLCGAADSDPCLAAGEGWALMDLASHVRDPALADRARRLASGRLTVATGARWSRRGRGLGALAHLARGGGHGGPALLGRLIFHRLTGR